MDLNALFFLGNAFVLGFRHGIDWDHIAAVMDITSAASSVEVPPLTQFGLLQKRAVSLSTLYAIGHAFVVVALGVATICFSAALPKWLGPFMERIVGITLVLFAAGIFYLLVKAACGKQDFKLQSRWMMFFSLFNRLAGYFRSRLFGATARQPAQLAQYGPRTAFSVGIIHGIGAETGTQLLLLASVGGTADIGLALAMLIVFVFGFGVSNAMVAVLSSTGIVTSATIKPVYLVLGAVTGFFSLAVGTFFIAGQSGKLPDLKQLLAFLS